MKFKVIVLLFFLFGCKNTNQDCIVDVEFKKNFDNCMQIAELMASSDSLNRQIDLVQSSKAFSCLEALTGVSGNLIQDDVGFGYYSSKEDFEKNKNQWQSWFEKNKCSMSMDSAESLFEKYREPLPAYNDPKVMERISQLWPENFKDSVRLVDSLQRIRYKIDWPTIIL